MEMDQLYTELILEHNQDKRNKHELSEFTNSEHGHNPSCGDDLTLQLNVVDGIIKDAAYTGSGCAISQASASMMIDIIKGKSVEEALRLVEIFLGMIKKEITDEKVLEAAAEAKEKLPIVKKEKGGIVVKGIDDVAVRFAKCCSPIPGDEIVGFVTRGRGVTIHRTDCVNVMNLSESERVRLIDAEWQGSNLTSGLYTAEINVYANNRTGLLVDISKIFTERKIDLTTINSRTSKQGRATISMTFDVHSTEELNSIVEKIRQVESVIDIERTTG